MGLPKSETVRAFCGMEQVTDLRVHEKASCYHSMAPCVSVLCVSWALEKEDDGGVRICIRCVCKCIKKLSQYKGSVVEQCGPVSVLGDGVSVYSSFYEASENV